MLGALYCLVIAASIVVGVRLGTGYGWAVLFALVGIIGIWGELGGGKWRH